MRSLLVARCQRGPFRPPVQQICGRLSRRAKSDSLDALALTQIAHMITIGEQVRGVRAYQSIISKFPAYNNRSYITKLLN
ncbi:MAG: hypothetical protein MUE40_21260 [Anaerolineae bacterium]|jgi:hypothetical protein|nr:hypothetical protein [Anaerolineae bacterium]